MNYNVRFVKLWMICFSHKFKWRHFLVFSGFTLLNRSIVRLINNRSENNVFCLTRIHWYKLRRTVRSFYHIVVGWAYFVDQGTTFYGRRHSMFHDLSFHLLCCGPFHHLSFLFKQLLFSTCIYLRSISFQLSIATNYECRVICTARWILLKPIMAILMFQWAAIHGTLCTIFLEELLI